LEDGYEGYRILSAVIHGSSGAMAGITRTIDGQVVHRTGPDLDLAATAWFEGLVSFYNVAAKVTDVTDAWEAEEMHGRTGNLILLWPQVRAALQRIDRRLWPELPPPGPQAVVAFYPNGVRKWYYYSPSEETLVLADPPGVEPDLSTMAEKVATYPFDAFNGRPLTAVCVGVRVRPQPGHQPFPSAAIMVPGDHPGRLSAPRLLDRPSPPSDGTRRAP
jgi:hypothetical protein